jgi:hypothetical protein
MTRSEQWFFIGIWLAGFLFGLWFYLAIAKWLLGLGE